MGTADVQPVMHVVFDLDGVLLDSESDLSWLETALCQTLETVGLENTQSNRAALFPPSRESLQGLAREADIPTDRLWEIRNRHYTDAKVAAIESGAIGPYPDLDAVSALADRYPLGIISNSPQAVVETFVESAGLPGVFDPVVGRGTALEDVDRLKPNPHLFERLHAKTATDEYVYVGDQETDRKFAAATGMAFVHLDREHGPVRTLYEVRDRIESL